MEALHGYTIRVANVEVDVVRKDIKHMHLAVYPPTGRIRLSAPERTDKEVLRLFVISRLGWIRKHVRNFREQPREAPKQYISGESHFFQGKRYLLKVVEHHGFNKVELKGKHLVMYVRPNSTREQRANILKEWYRKELKARIPGLIGKWEQVIGVTCNEWGVKHMRTKWGTCNEEARRIWLNLELAKKPLIYLEYIIVHELVHLLERKHNDRFTGYLDKFMPQWREYREGLKGLPVGWP